MVSSDLQVALVILSKFGVKDKEFSLHKETVAQRDQVAAEAPWSWAGVRNAGRLGQRTAVART